MRTNKDAYRTTFHRDGTVTIRNQDENRASISRGCQAAVVTTLFKSHANSPKACEIKAD